MAATLHLILSVVYIFHTLVASIELSLLIHKCDYKCDNSIQIIHTQDNFGKKKQNLVKTKQRGDDVAN